MDTCKFSHVISLQSVTLFVRLINQHCGKALMFMFFLMKGKGGKKAFQYRDNNPRWSSSQRPGLETDAHGSHKSS